MATPGKIVDYGMVVDWIGEACDRYDVRTLFYDPWNIRRLEEELEAHGFPFNRDRRIKTVAGVEGGDLRIVPHPQGLAVPQNKPAWELWPAMPRSLNNTEEVIAGGQLRCLTNPVLTMGMLGAAIYEDGSGNRRLMKTQASDKIDAAVALVTCLGPAFDAHKHLNPEASGMMMVL